MYTDNVITILLGGSTALLNPDLGVGWLIQGPPQEVDGVMVRGEWGAFDALAALRPLGWSHETEEYDEDDTLCIDLSEPLEWTEAGRPMWLLYNSKVDVSERADREIDRACDSIYFSAYAQH